jgi:hypothetical protein
LRVTAVLAAAGKVELKVQPPIESKTLKCGFSFLRWNISLTQPYAFLSDLDATKTMPSAIKAP